ncbi:unnamed protein product, partial [Rotaria magnacalcarata]
FADELVGVFQTDIINDTEFDLNILINTNHDRTTNAFQQLHTNETESDTTIEILEKTVDIEPKDFDDISDNEDIFLTSTSHDLKFGN